MFFGNGNTTQTWHRNYVDMTRTRHGNVRTLHNTTCKFTKLHEKHMHIGRTLHTGTHKDTRKWHYARTWDERGTKITQNDRQLIERDTQIHETKNTLTWTWHGNFTQTRALHAWHAWSTKRVTWHANYRTLYDMTRQLHKHDYKHKYNKHRTTHETHTTRPEITWHTGKSIPPVAVALIEHCNGGELRDTMVACLVWAFRTSAWFVRRHACRSWCSRRIPAERSVLVASGGQSDVDSEFGATDRAPHARHL